MPKYRKGVININILVGLGVILALIPILMTTFKLMLNISLVDEIIQNEIATLQIRRILLLAEEISVSPQQISYTLDEKSWEIKYLNNHIVLSPGSQIIYENVEDVSFYIEDKMIYVKYNYNHHNYSKQWGYQ